MNQLTLVKSHRQQTHPVQIRVPVTTHQKAVQLAKELSSSNDKINVSDVYRAAIEFFFEKGISKRD